MKLAREADQKKEETRKQVKGKKRTQKADSKNLIKASNLASARQSRFKADETRRNYASVLKAARKIFADNSQSKTAQGLFQLFKAEEKANQSAKKQAQSTKHSAAKALLQKTKSEDFTQTTKHGKF